MNKIYFAIAVMLLFGCGGAKQENPAVQETVQAAPAQDEDSPKSPADKALSSELNKPADKISLDSIRYFISNGADANSKNSIGYSVLQYAVSKNDTSLVKILIDKGAEINPSSFTGSSVLMICLEDGSPALMKYLIEKDADPNSHNFDGETILMFVVQAGNIEIAKMLLGHGADVNAKDDYGKPVIAWTKDPEMIKMLKENGAR